MTIGPSANHNLPFYFWNPVVSSDTFNLTVGVCRALYIGGGGNIAIVDQNGNVATWVGVVAGTTLYVAAMRVNATNTTASQMLALY